MGIALAGKAFSQAVRFFLKGDKSALEEARETLKNAESLFINLGLVEESNVVRSMRSLLPVMEKRATWTILPRFTSITPTWKRYLKLLG